MALTLSHYRFGIDELAENTHGWYAAEDANPAQGDILPGDVFLLRLCVQADATGLTNVDNEFQCRLNGGTWQNITTTSTIVRAVAAVALTNGGNCTKRLSGTGTFESSGAGQTEDGTSGGTANDIVASGNSETECGLQIQAGDVVHGDLIEFRLTRDGGLLLDTYAVVPAITVYEGTGTNAFLWPIDGWVSATVLYANGLVHGAGTADIAAPHWTPVVAARQGTVAEAGKDSLGNYYVILDHDFGWQTYYAHLAEQPLVVAAQVVAAGQAIGFCGRSGSASMPHVHFGISDAGFTGGQAAEDAGVALGDWVTRGTLIAGPFGSTLSAIAAQDTAPVALLTTINQPGYASADASDTVVDTVPAGTVLKREDTDVGFYKVTYSAQTLWVPWSSVRPLPTGDVSDLGAIGAGDIGDAFAIGAARPVTYSFAYVRTRRATAALDVKDVAGGNTLWRIPTGRVVTLFEDAGDGWSRIMDPFTPSLEGGFLGALYGWVPTADLEPVEDGTVIIATRNVPVRDAPATSGNLLYTYHLDAPPPGTARYHTLGIRGNVNGWYLIEWFGKQAYIPGWMTSGVR